MLSFKKYMHIERLGNDRVENIELGECFIFPKIDGCCSSVWLDNDICCGSRNRQISIENDNHGFAQYVEDNKDEFVRFFHLYPDLIIYGEFLIKHTLKTYRDDAWKQLYIFDVYDTNSNKYLHYNEYSQILDNYDFNYILPLAIIKNPTFDKLIEITNNNTYLMRDGEVGEGIVIKSFDYINKWDETVWAKLVRNEFKDKHRKTIGSPEVKMADFIEQKFVDRNCTSVLIEKTFNRIRLANNGWKSEFIPRLLNTVYYDLIQEELWSFIKKHKNPTINFSRVHYFTIQKIKEIKKNLF